MFFNSWSGSSKPSHPTSPLSTIMYKWSKLAALINLQEHECLHVRPQKHRQTHTQLRLRRRSGEWDHLMPADGVMEGGRRGGEKLEIRTTRPNAYKPVLRRWFRFTSCLLQCTHFMLDFMAEYGFKKTFSSAINCQLISWSICFVVKNVIVAKSPTSPWLFLFCHKSKIFSLLS